MTRLSATAIRDTAVAAGLSDYIAEDIAATLTWNDPAYFVPEDVVLSQIEAARVEMATFPLD